MLAYIPSGGGTITVAATAGGFSWFAYGLITSLFVVLVDLADMHSKTCRLYSLL